MPHVIRLGVSDGRSHTLAGHPQPRGKVVVFTAPADVFLIESVDFFQIAARDRYVEAHQLGLDWMMPQLIADVADPAPPHSPALDVRYGAAILRGSYVVYRQPFGRFAVEPKTIAGADDSRPPRAEMPFQVMGREQAVAVGEQQIGAATGSHSVVAAERHSETLVFMRGEPDWELGFARELVKDFVSSVLRSVVDDDDFKAAIHVDLLRERSQRPLEVARPFEGRQNYREFQPRRHAAITFPRGRADRAAG